jgi:sec-independent protein translocase protein TatA
MSLRRRAVRGAVPDRFFAFEFTTDMNLSVSGQGVQIKPAFDPKNRAMDIVEPIGSFLPRQRKIPVCAVCWCATAESSCAAGRNKMLNNIGLPGLLLIAVVVLVLFGRGKISSLMGEVGKGITAFKKGVKESNDEIEDSTEVVRDVTPETEEKDKV